MCLTPKYLALLPQPSSLVPFLKGRIFCLQDWSTYLKYHVWFWNTGFPVSYRPMSPLLTFNLTTSRPTHCTLLKLGKVHRGPFNWRWETGLASLPLELYMVKHRILYLVVTQGFNSEGRIPWTTRRRRLSSWVVRVARPWWTHTATYQAGFCEWRTDTNQEHSHPREATVLDQRCPTELSSLMKISYIWAV